MIQYASNGGQVLPKCLQSKVKIGVTSEVFRTRSARGGYLLVVDHGLHQPIVSLRLTQKDRMETSGSREQHHAKHFDNPCALTIMMV